MVRIKEFFDNEYTSYGSYDLSRKITNLIDGFKISQRKVFHTIVKNNIDSETKEIKVDQIASKTSEQTSYLHGQDSLVGVTVGLAVNYVGSNNINLLYPNGSFGNRFERAPAAGRYIYTYLNDISKYVFRKEDEPLLNLQVFEGQVIEPKYYYPIIPMCLVNGSEALSIGFSSKIANRDPKEIISWIKNKLKGKKSKKEFLPWYSGYKGTIESTPDAGKYLSKGDYTQDSKTQLTITEVPTKYNLNSYIKVLDTLCDKGIIKSYKDLSDNDEFKFEVRVKMEFFDNKSKDDILTTLKLVESINDNLTLLDEKGCIKEFQSIEEILEYWYAFRFDIYQKRKDYQLNKLKNDLKLDEFKYKFIKDVLSKVIKIDQPIKDVENQLVKLNYEKIEDSYDYLLNMRISSMTQDRLNELSNKIEKTKEQITDLTNKTIEEIWETELNELNSKL